MFEQVKQARLRVHSLKEMRPYMAGFLLCAELALSRPFVV